MHLWMIPLLHIPFIKSNFDLLFQSHRHKKSLHSPNGIFRMVSKSQNCLIVRGGIGLMNSVPVLMYRNPVQIWSAVLQQINIPIQICQRGRSKFYRRIDMLHHFCGFRDDSPPFFDRLCPDLPIPIILISNTPVFHLIRLGMSVFDPPFCITPFRLQITIFYPVTHFLYRAGSGICTDIGFAADFTTHLYIFIRSECVRLFHPPRLIKKRLSFLSHRIFPMVGGNETASRPSYNRNMNVS